MTKKAKPRYETWETEWEGESGPPWVAFLTEQQAKGVGAEHGPGDRQDHRYALPGACAVSPSVGPMTGADLIDRARRAREAAVGVALLFAPMWLVVLLVKRRGRGT
jgi:hypothetical protein